MSGGFSFLAVSLLAKDVLSRYVNALRGHLKTAEARLKQFDADSTSAKATTNKGGQNVSGFHQSNNNNNSITGVTPNKLNPVFAARSTLRSPNASIAPAPTATHTIATSKTPVLKLNGVDNNQYSALASPTDNSVQKSLPGTPIFAVTGKDAPANKYMIRSPTVSMVETPLPPPQHKRAASDMSTMSLDTDIKPLLESSVLSDTGNSSDSNNQTMQTELAILKEYSPSHDTQKPDVAGTPASDIAHFTITATNVDATSPVGVNTVPAGTSALSSLPSPTKSAASSVPASRAVSPIPAISRITATLPRMHVRAHGHN